MRSAPRGLVTGEIAKVGLRFEPDEVSAQFRDGVLTIRLPKSPEAIAQKQGRKIEVNKATQNLGGSNSA